MAKVMKVHPGQANLGQRRTPHLAPEVAIPRRRTGRASDTSESGWLAVNVAM
jgi:hypothetical protein